MEDHNDEIIFLNGIAITGGVFDTLQYLQGAQSLLSNSLRDNSGLAYELGRLSTLQDFMVDLLINYESDNDIVVNNLRIIHSLKAILTSLAAPVDIKGI